ncbi:maleylpyruvate isomerase N-terminal domain-containing protein [Streptomyces cyaneofuscatus]|uniref:maleylpyruvate isomerase N-terminal domain-containing protein n=1 Tax=Streptomyces cyaneofuscatus TaxID=66883 RepID=UPI0036D94F9F
MGHDQALEAFQLECGALGDAVAGLSDAEWNLPTRCTPWTVRDLLGHVCVVIDWLPAILDAPSPPEAEISAVEYYRPDDRFSPQTDAKRIALAQDRAARPADGGAFAEDFAATWRRAYRLCRDQPGGRTVRTRHGGAMLLAELLLGAEHAPAADKLEWSRSRFLRKATGRELLNEAEAAQAERLGIRWLALG